MSKLASSLRNLSPAFASLMCAGLMCASLVFASLVFGPSAASAQSLGPTLQKIKESGTITIGNRDSSVPFSYLDDAQKPIGFSLDLCNLVVAKLKTKLDLPNLKVVYPYST